MHPVPPALLTGSNSTRAERSTGSDRAPPTSGGAARVARGPGERGPGVDLPGEGGGAGGSWSSGRWFRVLERTCDTSPAVPMAISRPSPWRSRRSSPHRPSPGGRYTSHVDGHFVTCDGSIVGYAKTGHVGMLDGRAGGRGSRATRSPARVGVASGTPRPARVRLRGSPPDGRGARSV